MSRAGYVKVDGSCRHGSSLAVEPGPRGAPRVPGDFGKELSTQRRGHRTWDNLDAVKPDLLELLPQIVLFVVVAQAKSFTRAARNLGMPVSTLSRRIAGLESQLGIQLLVRTTRLVELTEGGARYFERCRQILDAAETANSELRGYAEAPRGKLRISATQDFALIYLTPMIADFAVRYPDISLELDLTPRPVDMVAEGFDVAIRMARLPDSQLTARKLGTVAVGLYAAPAFLKRAGPVTAPKHLSDRECIRILTPLKGSTRWTLKRGAREEHVEVRGRIVANSMRFQLDAAVLGMGIVMVNEVMAKPAVADGRLVRVLPEWSPQPVPVHALTPSRLLPAKTKLFLECLTAHLTTVHDHAAALG
jgi:DNA-binding transcriptional LysR family regulator